MKTGRNALCPCGSRRKYKKCCLATRDRNVGQPPRTPLPAEVQRAFVAMQQSEAARIQKYGYVRPPITENFQGQQFVAVGSRLLFDAKWKTFHDFLFTYLGAVFEKEWFAAELRQPLETRHPLMQWYKTLHEFDAARRTLAERGQVLRIDEPPAEISALLSFAYDLYTLENYSLLPERLVKRLQHRDQFQGARYETYVAAAFVRAGFVVTPEDERDVTSSHCGPCGHGRGLFGRSEEPPPRWLPRPARCANPAAGNTRRCASLAHLCTAKRSQPRSRRVYRRKCPTR